MIPCCKRYLSKYVASILYVNEIVKFTGTCVDYCNGENSFENDALITVELTGISAACSTIYRVSVQSKHIYNIT